MQIILNVKDEKVPFFMEMIKNFSFVEVNPPQVKERVLNELKEAVENVNLAKKGKLTPKPLKKLLDEL